MLASGYPSHFRKTFLLAYPVVLSQLGHTLVLVCDSVMVGRTGTVPLAAASLGNSIFSVIMVFGLGLSFGITPSVAAADGRKNHRRLALLLTSGLFICLLTGIFLFLVGYAFSPHLYYLRQPAAVVKLAIPYLQILLTSLLPLMVFQGLKQFAEGLSLTRQAMYISVLANVLNFGLNYLLVFGNAGFPRLGLNGAALATLLARITMALLMGFYIWQSPRFVAYRPRTRRKLISLKHTRRIFKLGFPIAGQMLFEVSAFGFSAIMIGWLGARQLAAHQIAINVASVTYMMASGLAAAATVRVSNELGQGRYHEMQRAGFSSIFMALLFMTVTATLMIAGKNYIPLLYGQDSNVLRMAAGLLVIAAVFQLSDGVQVAGLGALRGLEDVKVPGLISLLAYWVVGLPIGYGLGFRLGLGANGVWLGLLAGLTVAALLLTWRFKKLAGHFIRNAEFRS